MTIKLDPAAMLPRRFAKKNQNEKVDVDENDDHHDHDHDGDGMYVDWDQELED